MFQKLVLNKQIFNNAAPCFSTAVFKNYTCPLLDKSTNITLLNHVEYSNSVTTVPTNIVLTDKDITKTYLSSSNNFSFPLGDYIIQDYKISVSTGKLIFKQPSQKWYQPSIFNTTTIMQKSILNQQSTWNLWKKNNLEKKLSLLQDVLNKNNSGMLIGSEYLLNEAPNFRQIKPIDSNDLKSLLGQLKIREEQVFTLNALEKFYQPESQKLSASALAYFGLNNAQSNSTFIKSAKEEHTYIYKKMGYYGGDDSFLRDLILGSTARIGTFKIKGERSGRTQNNLLLVCADLQEQNNIFNAIEKSEIKLDNVFLLSGSIPFDSLNLNLVSKNMNNNGLLIYNDHILGSDIFQFKKQEHQAEFQLLTANTNEMIDDGLYLKNYKFAIPDPEEYSIIDFKCSDT